jgi:glycine cleavage system H protein
MSIIKFSQTHEWAKIEEDLATIGISQYAQKALGDIVFVELPRGGEKIRQGEQFGTIESTKAASELYAPLSGEVIEANKDLINSPQWVNEDPFGKGWMIKIKILDKKEAEKLMDESAYREFIAKETH